MVKKLSAEEIEELLKSPHILKIHPISGQIVFSPEFKRMAYGQLLGGKITRVIFEENGIDPNILGESRINSFNTHLKEKANRDKGFEDQRSKNLRKPKKETKEQTMVERIELLEHELAYTRQEVEFLKKIRMADLEAQKQWESKHRRK